MASHASISTDGDVVDGAEPPYRHIRMLGHGHSGAVEEVADKATGKIYARKTIILRGSIHNKEEATRVFRNEVKNIQGLESHHHIIRVHTTYVHEKVMGILLEPVARGGDLDQYLADYEDCMQSITVPNARALAMTAILEKGFGCLAAGLAFMHKKRIRHKDIKLHNILVHEGMLIFTDFGYSFDSNEFTRSTTEGPAEYLTRRYSSPEVIEGGSKNSKSDVFSLGCVFVDMFLIMNRNTRAQPREQFRMMMDKLHAQILSTATPASLDILPDVIARMTALENSARLCSTHAAAYLLQRTNLRCNQCALSPIDEWQERVRGDGCPPLRMDDPTLGIQRSITRIAISPPDTRHAESQSTAGATVAPGSSVENSYLLGSFSETQDTGYARREPAEAHHFFQTGRIFATRIPNSKPSKFIGSSMSENSALKSHGESPVSRRFVVVQAQRKQRLVHACEISTYNDRGTLDRACNSKVHAIVYVKGSQPTKLAGEKEKGMYKDPIALEATEHTIRYSPTSRLNFGKALPFDRSIMVQDHGCVVAEDMTKLVGYYRQEQKDVLDRSDE